MLRRKFFTRSIVTKEDRLNKFAVSILVALCLALSAGINQGSSGLRTFNASTRPIQPDFQVADNIISDIIGIIGDVSTAQLDLDVQPY
jgi:hypothetical protein